MGLVDAVRDQLRSKEPASGSPEIVGAAPVADHKADETPDVQDEKKLAQGQVVADVEGGVQAIEATQAVWGKKGRWLVIAGLAMLMIIYEIDNTTVYIYRNYAVSSFNALAQLSTITTASTIVFAVIKPPLAKLSNVIGRGQTYLLTISFYVLSYILMASAKSMGQYSVGIIFHSIGQSGTNLMNDVIISDITTARWRGFAIGVSFFPFLIIPWISAFIVSSAVGAHGIGWRWGIGMLSLLMPFCASFIITTVLYYQGRAKKLGLTASSTESGTPAAPAATKARLSVYAFCSEIDLGGVILFSGGLAMVLLPLTLAATTPSRWSTPYLDALIAVGGAMLVVLPFYEQRWARHPFLPMRYFRNLTIMLCLFLNSTDSLGFSVTHTYLYSWGVISRNFDARTSTYFVYLNGITQCLMGIIGGLIMARTRRYKYLCFAGTVIRTVGYGVMLRLRGAENPTAELFLVQAVQGIGSGIMSTALLVPAQISVPHSEMAQVTALVISLSFVGSSIGACIAGGIYTNTLKPALWRHLGSAANDTMVDSLYNSITTSLLPEWGTHERTSVNMAFTDVMRYMTYGALGSSIPSLFLTLLLPNHELPERNNLVEH